MSYFLRLLQDCQRSLPNQPMRLEQNMIAVSEPITASHILNKPQHIENQKNQTPQKPSITDTAQNALPTEAVLDAQQKNRHSHKENQTHLDLENSTISVQKKTYIGIKENAHSKKNLDINRSSVTFNQQSSEQYNHNNKPRLKSKKIITPKEVLPTTAKKNNSASIPQKASIDASPVNDHNEHNHKKIIADYVADSRALDSTIDVKTPRPLAEIKRAKKANTSQPSPKRPLSQALLNTNQKKHERIKKTAEIHIKQVILRVSDQTQTPIKRSQSQSFVSTTTLSDSAKSLREI